MERTLPSDHCPVTWCTVTGIHDDHQQTLGTWLGEAAKGPTRGMTTQLIVHGSSETDVRPVIAVQDPTSTTLEQWACELTWEALVEFVAQAAGAIVRFGARRP